MIYHDCDQFSADLQWAQEEIRKQFDVPVTLHIVELEEMIEAVAIRYPVEEFEELLEHVLDTRERTQPFLHPMQRKGYKKCLGKIFWRRSDEARQKTKEFRKAHGFV
jgi:hypothetical protein